MQEEGERPDPGPDCAKRRRHHKMPLSNERPATDLPPRVQTCEGDLDRPAGRKPIWRAPLTQQQQVRLTRV